MAQLLSRRAFLAATAAAALPLLAACAGAPAVPTVTPAPAAPPTAAPAAAPTTAPAAAPTTAPAAAAPAAAGAPGQLTWWHHWVTEDNKKKVINGFIEDYQKEKPNTKI